MFSRFRLKALRAFIPLAVLVGCGEVQPSASPPPSMSFDGLPVTGSLADARKAGFTRCIELAMGFRCRKANVMLQGQGPYEAAVDLKGRDGSGGFTEISLWHDRSQNALFAVGDELERNGWTPCLTGDGNKEGDQKIWTLKGAPVRFSMDISYWGKRRLRLVPLDGKPEAGC